RAWCPPWRRKGISDDELLAALLAVRTAKGAPGDAFRDGLMLPITGTADRIIGSTARGNPAVDGDEAVPKSLNTTTAVYDKHRALSGSAPQSPGASPPAPLPCSSKAPSRSEPSATSDPTTHPWPPAAPRSPPATSRS
ncbi:hypothetical protein ACIPY4_21270, partial [Cellulosimicrobium cellulans]